MSRTSAARAALLAGVAVALLLAAYSPLISATGIFYDDFPYVYLRIHQYAQEFAAGHLPQVLPDAVRGGGSAFPRFYPPLAYYLGAAVYGVVGNFVLAGNLTALLSVLLSAVTMGWSVTLLGGRPVIAVVAGLAYATMPYRFTNVLIRGALAESWALVWLPLVLAFAVRLARDRAPGLPLAIGVGLLLLTHTGLALWALPLTLAVAGCMAPPGQRREAAIRLGWFAGLGVGLAAWYLVPAWHYLPEVGASDPVVIWATAADFGRWKIGVWDVLGFSKVGWSPLIDGPLPVPIAVSLGVPVLILPVALLALWKEKRSAAGTSVDHRLPLAAALAAALTTAVILRPAAVAGWIPQPWLYLQFPYRLAGLAGMLATVAIALALSAVPRHRVVPALLGAWGVMVGATAALSPSVPNQVASEAQLVSVLHRRENDLTARNEYLPTTGGADHPGSRVEAARRSLRAMAASLVDTTDRFAAVISATDSTLIALPRVSYDFLKVSVDGSPVPAGSDNGVVTVCVPPGTHTVTITRRLSPPLLLGLATTALSALILVLVTLGERRRRSSGSTRRRFSTPR